MEVIIPSNNLDFDFNSARSSPVHVSAVPSTPKRFGEYYFSAPTSPSHISQFYQDFDDDFLVLYGNESGSTVGSGTELPFGWEGKTVTQKSPVKISTSSVVNGDNDFAFDVMSEEWETGSQISAEELFDGGVIKAVPLKPPPPLLQLPPSVGLISDRETFLSPIRQTRKMMQGAFSPRGKSKKEAEARRGRERSQVDVSKSYSRRKAARSLSPIRDNELYQWEEEKQQSNNNNAKNLPNSSSSILCSSLTSGGSSKGGSKKWRLKDFFLFRSASEGRAADKDHLKNYTAAYSSFRSVDSPGSGSGSYKRGPISAHELHYTMNRAVSEDLKKKTFLPYKQGILGRLAFNPAVHALANGFGFSHK